MFTFFGRSGALKAVDSALRNFHQHQTGDRARAVKSALAAWVNSKPNGWSGAGGRNARGTVDDLRQQIDKYLTPILPVLAGPLPPPVPIAVPIPPPLPVVSASAVAAQMYVPGKLIHAKLGGNHFEIPLQQKGSSCGPACLRILIMQVGNVSVGEEALRATIDGSLGSGGVVVSNNSHDWINQGTWGMDNVLAKYRIEAKLHCTNPNQFLLAATLKKPCIAVVQWAGAGGGLHYIVVVGKNSVGTITVLDPWYGLQQLTISNAGGVETVDNYDPNENGINYPSTWYQWVLAVK
ncbi:papain-like cysteine protease family protein [Massilia pseudoviolaceinigra]|uniref:papain-like cysteine protease family protein n=1 Tax=Massilia pseudoviolaceinigra TaxID=3057165 RepID=UPI002796DA63|nr:papain-like cysteine protease family protein [Massilia sp. CCM 9206]MDQ1919148.1 papain-like cysteine protease family protein [Massilia sp. CCM 9206]